MWIQAYQGTLSTAPSIPVTREVSQIEDPDSIGLNIKQLQAPEEMLTEMSSHIKLVLWYYNMQMLYMRSTMVLISSCNIIIASEE